MTSVTALLLSMGLAVASSEERGVPALEALGAPSPRVVGMGLLRAVPRWVLPRLARLGVIPRARAR
jgi:hypothetical protein